MSHILVFCEHQQGKIKKGALELLSAAQSSGRKVFAAAFGPNAKQLESSLAKYGVSEFWVSDDPIFQNYNPEIYRRALLQVTKQAQATVVLGSASMLARDLFPRVAAALDSGIASDCTSLELTTNSLKVRKPLYSGKCTAEVEFVDSPLQFVLMRPNQLPVAEGKTGGSVTLHNVTPESNDLKINLQSVQKGTSEKPDLAEANVIVSGGRGLQAPENFKLLESLAEPMNATVGASRAVVDAGWVPHSMQVGQTGKTVAPSLYFAVGISGAIQHLAGMSGSKVIVAINKDPDAPIFQKANYGIVGDLFEVLPKLKDEIQKIL